MTNDVFEKVQFASVIKMISPFCVSEDGKIFLENLPCYTQTEKIENAISLSNDFECLYNFLKKRSIVSWKPIANALALLEKDGSTLSLEDAHALLTFCISLLLLKKSIEKNKNELSIFSLEKKIAELPNLLPAEKNIRSLIENDGSVKNISPLREIKNEIETLQKKISAHINAYFENPKYAHALTTRVPVLKNMRECLSIKTSERNLIQGILLGTSPSNQTSFIEPSDVVSLSNELVEKQNEWDLELHRVLRELTEKLRAQKTDFENAKKIMSALDVRETCAFWKMQNNFSFVKPSHEKNLNLISARHPLLGNTAIPIDFLLEEKKRACIISGANAGGKTATLKTIALLSLMHQCALPLPCDEKSTFPIFKKIFIDIGDGQSLEENLSTFSAKMKTFSKILDESDDETLVLLDELGSGTDAEEGAALSESMLDYFIEQKTLVIVTTHLSSLKNYASVNEYATNASVLFDDKNLLPQYKIIMNVSGESHALSIAEKNGIKKEIIEKAKNYLAKNETSISHLIADLQKNERALFEKKLQIEKDAEIILQKNRELENLIQKNKTFAKNLKAETLLEKENYFRETKNAFEKIVKEIRESKNIEKTLQSARSEINALQDKIENEKNELRESETQNYVFKVGEEIQSKRNRERGTLIKKNANNFWLVQFKSMQMNLHESEFSACKKNESAKKIAFDFEKDDEPAFELRLLGMKKDEALAVLQKQLDACITHNFLHFSIIHGMGSGVLQKAVHDFLKSEKCVKEFHFAETNDGGFGKTYVSLE